jgi:hypothetical protein
LTYVEVSKSQTRCVSKKSYLQPVATALARLIATLGRVQHFHHQTLTRGLDTGLEQFLDLIKDIGVAILGKLELALNGLEAFVHKLPTFSEGLLYARLLQSQ